MNSSHQLALHTRARTFAALLKVLMEAGHSDWVTRLIRCRRLFVCIALSAGVLAIGCAHTSDGIGAGFALELSGEFTVRQRVETRSVVFRDAEGAEWFLIRNRVTHAIETESEPGSIAQRFIDDARLEVDSKRSIPWQSADVHIEIDETLPGGRVLLLHGRQFYLHGKGERQLRSRLEFYVFWPASEPDVAVQGSVEWKGELKPRVETVLQTVRSLRLLPND